MEHLYIQSPIPSRRKVDLSPIIAEHRSSEEYLRIEERGHAYYLNPHNIDYWWRTDG